MVGKFHFVEHIQMKIGFNDSHAKTIVERKALSLSLAKTELYANQPHQIGRRDACFYLVNRLVADQK